MKKNWRLAQIIIVWVGVPVVIAFFPSLVVAQSDVEELGKRHGVGLSPFYYQMVAQNPGLFEFSENGAWRHKARVVAENRNAFRSNRNQLALASGAANMAAVSGDLNVPVLLVLYANTDSAALVGFADRPTLENRLFGTTPAPPYTIHNYYQELSNGALRINGTFSEWVRVPSNDADYEGPTSPKTNGLCLSTCISRLIEDVVLAADPSIDFSMFDNDGPDNIPNSGDDDGLVDVLVIVHPELDGSCGPRSTNNNIWAHRSFYGGISGSGAPLPTADVAAGGFNIGINDYIVQGGQGGENGCTPNQPQAMGVVAHELGHAFDLPDLYDTSIQTEGIGAWGLMGSGNWHIPTRPIHMSAWSKGQLGWITQVLIDTDTTLTVSPIESADTSYLVSIPSTNEYFELSNRQQFGADSSLLFPRAGGVTLNTGLLIWHTDSSIIKQRLSTRNVNAGGVHGLALEEADDSLHLWRSVAQGSNRGDSGDPFPGREGVTAFGFNTSPSSARNDGTASYVTIDQITQQSDKSITLRVSYQLPVVVSLSHSRDACSHCSQFWADFTANSFPVNTEFVQVLDLGATVSVAIDSVQLRDNDRRRFTWLSWSDGGARVHDLVASGAGDSLIGQMKAEFLVEAAATGQGSVNASGASTMSVGPDSNDSEFVDELQPLTLVAAPETGFVFDRWFGNAPNVFSDTVAIASMTEPLNVAAVFSPLLSISTASLAQGLMGFVYRDSMVATGGNGDFSWSVAEGRLPGGMAVSPGGVVQGTPSETGSFPIVFRAESGFQTEDVSVSIEIIQPALVANDVVSSIFAGEGLSSDELNFLDLQGNSNGRFDLGDFLAWVDQNDISVSAGVVERLAELDRNGRSKP